jgi:hypothetical protein
MLHGGAANANVDEFDLNLRIAEMCSSAEAYRHRTSRGFIRI